MPWGRQELRGEQREARNRWSGERVAVAQQTQFETSGGLLGLGGGVPRRRDCAWRIWLAPISPHSSTRMGVLHCVCVAPHSCLLCFLVTVGPCPSLCYRPCLFALPPLSFHRVPCMLLVLCSVLVPFGFGCGCRALRSLGLSWLLQIVVVAVGGAHGSGLFMLPTIWCGTPVAWSD